jgi:hypothetical protein
MTTNQPLLDLELLNLATAASLARNGILRSIPAHELRDNPFHHAARLLRHIRALEDALRDYDQCDYDIVPTDDRLF